MVSFYDGGRLFGHQSNVMPGALISLAPEIEYMATDKFALSLGVNVDWRERITPVAASRFFSMVYSF